MKNALIVTTLLLVLLAACGPAKYDKLAHCLTDKGVTFYGAFWCPHCANQKTAFGSSMQNINYVECSLPDKSGQTQICIDANITGYPTWEFPDGTRLTGEKSPEELGRKVGCTVE